MQVEDTPQRNAARRRLFRRGVVVLYEDNHLLGIAKPAGLLSQGGPQGEESLTDLLDAYRREAEGKPGRAYVGLVHRLDRNVSGTMVIARTSKAAGRLAAYFRDRVPELAKTYLAWVERVPEETAGRLVHVLRREGGVTMQAAEGDPDGREAALRYEVVATSQRGARVRITLETGLPHQIRAQMAIVGHPLFGDVKYRGPDAKRVALHAAALSFPHPVRGDLVELAAPVPYDLQKLDARLQMQPPV